jgi:hypothetical protein
MRHIFMFGITHSLAGTPTAEVASAGDRNTPLLSTTDSGTYQTQPLDVRASRLDFQLLLSYSVFIEMSRLYRAPLAKNTQ